MGAIEIGIREAIGRPIDRGRDRRFLLHNNGNGDVGKQTNKQTKNGAGIVLELGCMIESARKQLYLRNFK